MTQQELLNISPSFKIKFYQEFYLKLLNLIIIKPINQNKYKTKNATNQKNN